MYTTNNLDLDYIECNALRYVAGHAIRHLKKKLERGSHPLRKQLLCLTELYEKSGIDDNIDAEENTVRNIS